VIANGLRASDNIDRMRQLIGKRLLDIDVG